MIIGVQQVTDVKIDSGECVVGTPWKVCAESFSALIDDFEKMQTVLGYPKLDKKDEVVLGHFINHLVENYLILQPPQVEAQEGEK